MLIATENSHTPAKVSKPHSHTLIANAPATLLTLGTHNQKGTAFVKANTLLNGKDRGYSMDYDTIDPQHLETTKANAFYNVHLGNPHIGPTGNHPSDRILIVATHVKQGFANAIFSEGTIDDKFSKIRAYTQKHT